MRGLSDSMLYVITGGSGSGKSEYAERAAVRMFGNLQAGCAESCENDREESCAEHCENDREESCAEHCEKSCAKGTGAGRLYYVATMKPYDEECYRRIARHRQMRREKGFTTLECPCHIEEIKATEKDVLLLEDLSNLLANEQYLKEGRIRGNGEEIWQQAAQAILHPIIALSRTAGGVVVVTNEIFSDGVSYEEETERYCRLLGFLNRELAQKADGVAEVVCSIPICQKGELPC